MTERYGERRDHPVDEPAPTLTSKARSDVWVVDRRTNSRAAGGGQAPTVPVPMSRPAPTMTGKSGTQWVFHRPSTCVMGDPRIAAPGYRGGHDDRSTTMMADAIRITLQEALILQSFDPAYPVQGTKTKQFEQVGNAVPPRLAQAVLEALVGRDASRNTPPDDAQSCMAPTAPSVTAASVRVWPVAAGEADH